MELDRYILCNPVSSIKGTLSRVCMAIMMLFVAVVFICATASAEELHVGSEEVYSTISSAVNAASEGDVVIVHAGNYIENVDVDKRLDLRGAGANVVIVNAANQNDQVFDVCANRVNISGFTVTGASPATNDEMIAGISLNSTEQCSIFDNKVLNNNYGLSMYSSNSNTLTNNSIESNYYGGIMIFASSNNNTLNYNIVLKNENGISLSESNDNILSSNNISNNGIGITLSESSSNTLKNNTFYSNYYEGIWMVDSSNSNILMGNNVSENYYGIYLSDSFDNLIYNNYFNNTDNSYDDGNNIWNTTIITGINIIGGPWLSGNYWSNYRGGDTDGDGLGDIFVPHRNDYHPLVPLNFAPIIIKIHTPTESTPVYKKGAEQFWVNFTDTFTLAITMIDLVDVALLNKTVIKDLVPGASQNVTLNVADEDSGIYNITVTVTSEVTGSIVAETSNIMTTVIGSADNVDLYVNQTGWWCSCCTFNACTSPIQAAVNAANAGDTIYVFSGSYIENVDVDKSITLQGEGADVVTVTAADPGDHVFDVYASRVNISGFTVTGADGHHFDICDDIKASGIILHHSYCNISDNNISKNHCGISLVSSSYNMLTNNNISNNVCGIDLFRLYMGSCEYPFPFSNYNTLTNNTVNSNEKFGISLHSSSNNILSGNTANSNGEFGIVLFSLTFCFNWDIIYNYDYRDVLICQTISSDHNILTNNTANSNNRNGIYVWDSNSNTLIKNTANLNKYHGINLDNSDNNTLTDNTANLNRFNGIYLFHSNDNTYTNNTVSNNSCGINMSSSINNTFLSNGILHNTYNFCIIGKNPYHYFQNIDTSNMVDGKPIYYWVDKQDKTVPDNAGFVGIINSDNITVRNLSLTNNYEGILFAYTKNSKIDNITADQNRYGIYLDSSTENVITNSTINSNTYYGIDLHSSNNNLIYNNYFNNTNNTRDDGNNIWNTFTTTGTNIIGGCWLSGNYWDDYTGNDTDSDGLGNTLTPHNSSGNIINGGDYHPLVRCESEPPPIIITAPTRSAPVCRNGAEQLWINFTCFIPDLKNYTIIIRNSTTIINSTTIKSNASGTEHSISENFYLNSSATDGLYNVSVEIYDTASNYYISYQNNSVVKSVYNAVISQPADQITYPDKNAVYELEITNTGNFKETYMLAITMIDPVDIAVLNKTEIIDMEIGASCNVTLYIADADVGIYRTIVNVISKSSGIEVAQTGYIMTFVNNNVDPVDICVNTSGWWRKNGRFNNCTAPIQTAINIAATGENIFVYNGSYTEEVYVNKKLTLQGESANGVIVHGVSAWGNVMNVGSDWVNISGFTLRPEHGYMFPGNSDGIYVVGNNCIISNNIIPYSTGNGISVFGNYCNILNNNISGVDSNNGNGGAGIFIAGNYCNIYNNNLSRINKMGYYYYENDNVSGIHISGNYCNISNNDLSKISSYDICGIYINGEYNTISNNNVSISSKGISLYNSDNSKLTNNTFTNNGFFIYNSYRSIVKNNSVNEKPLVYYEDTSDFIIQNAGQIILVNCTNFTIRNMNISNTYAGIELWKTDDCKIENNTILRNGFGIYLHFSSGNLIYNNIFNNTNNAYDDGNNTWNTTKTAGLNIIGGPYISGNYWSDYKGNDTDSDGFGDTQIPYNSSGNIANGGDYHPLVTTHSTKIYIEDIIINPKEKITVPIMINSPTDLGICAININFNSSILHVTDITPGDMGDLIYNFNNTTGWMYISVINRSGLSGNVIFAYLKLAAIGSIDDTSLLDITVEQLYDIHYMPIDHIVSDGTFTIADNRPPVVTDASASRNTILNDNGRLRAPGTNVTVLSAIVTDAKSSSISKVTINLSSIGGSSVQPMERIPGTDIWEVTTNAVEGINHTHQLTINATDIRGNYNNSVNITLSVLRRGDVNRDNIIDSKDVIYIARYLTSLEPEYSNPPGILVADVVGISADPKGDGVVDLLDALYIKRYEVGLEDEP